jgi:hypothetical protein
MAGNYNSTRWGNGHRRKIAVEECEKRKAGICPVCSGRCMAIYLPANHLRDLHRCTGWACRLCHRLTYASNQTWRSRAAKLLFEPGLQMVMAHNALAALRHETERLPLGVRDESSFNQVASIARSVETARRYKRPARRQKARKSTRSCPFR